MSLATHSPLSTSLPDTVRQVSSESEQNLYVSCLNHFPLGFWWQLPDSGFWLRSPCKFPEHTHHRWHFCRRSSCGLYKQLIIVHILSARTMSISPPPILGKWKWRSIYFKNQTLVHCLLDGKMYLTVFGRFLFILLIVNWFRDAPVSSGEQEGLERLRSVSNL